MPPAPVHARQRRRRLLTLVATLLVVTVVSTRLRDPEAPAAEGEDGVGRTGVRVAFGTPAADAADAVATLTPAQTSRDLFVYVPQPAHAEELEGQAPMPATEVYYIALNQQLLTGKASVFWKPGSRLNVPLPDGTTIEVEIEHTEHFGPDQFTSEGHVVGVPGSRAIFAYSNGRFSARFEGLPQGDFQLRSLTDPKGNQFNQFYAVDGAQIPNCGGPSEPGADDGQDAGNYIVDGSKEDGVRRMRPETMGDEVEAVVNGQAIIDVLVAYTQFAREAAGTADDLRAQIALGLAKVNADFRASGISARVRLAGTMEVDYAEDRRTGQAGDAYFRATLDRLSDPYQTAFARVREERDRVGADLVCLVVNRGSPTGTGSVAGTGYILKKPNDYLNPYYAFSIIHRAYVGGDGSVLSHELGHNLGCAHARGDPDAQPAQGQAGTYAYSYAYRFNATDTLGRTREFRTIMAYEPGQRLPYFSNPRVTLPSARIDGTLGSFDPEPALGIAEGAQSADNARTIERNAFQVASYRISTDYSAAGRLVNVSTRAHVGTGSNVMIGGFVLSGSEKKPVLIRALGPGLSELGVPKALVDPVLQLNHHAGTTTRIAWNDDWARQEAGSPMSHYASVNRTATGLPLSANSRDAALLLELEPGAYTAVVSGKNGTTGEALFEAYEHGSSDSTVVNLSTRAYGSSSQPIIAGFVVQADPERPRDRKRVFIRVRGASLSGHGFVPMADPVMQLFDVHNEIVLENDDWDAPTTYVKAPEQPLMERGKVDQPLEQAAFDANKAVGGGVMPPTEPAVVVELTPGAYTIMVKPYVPADKPDQPAEAGVAIVEVFEMPERPEPVEPEE